MAKTWQLSNQTKCLHGVLNHHNEVVSENCEKAESLGSCWEPTFGKLPKSNSRIENFVKTHISKWSELEGMAPPNLGTSKFLIISALESAAGPDGIGYRCWAAAPDWAARTMFEVWSCFAPGNPPPAGFKASLGFFFTKREQS